MKLAGIIVGLSIAFFAADRTATAQATAALGDGITVSGMGQITVKPNKLEIDVRTSAAAELTADAVVKYRDALRRAKDAIDKLKIENLQIVDRGMNMVTNGIGPQNGNPFMNAVPAPGMPGQAGNATGVKQEVAITKTLRLTVKGIEKMSEEEVVALVAKLLDVVKDAGLAAGPVGNNSGDASETPTPNAVVMFIADDLTAARKRATEEAFGRAKEKALRIAELTGGKLGAASAVEELPTLPGSNEEVIAENMLAAIYSGGGMSIDEPRLRSGTLVDMPLRVNLRVRFALQPSGGTK